MSLTATIQYGRIISSTITLWEIGKYVRQNYRYGGGFIKPKQDLQVLHNHQHTGQAIIRRREEQDLGVGYVRRGFNVCVKHTMTLDKNVDHSCSPAWGNCSEIMVEKMADPPLIIGPYKTW